MATSISARCWWCRATRTSSTSRASRRDHGAAARQGCPMRDVAGLLRSFDYAAAAAAPGRVGRLRAGREPAADRAARSSGRARRRASSKPIAACSSAPSRAGCRRRPKARCWTCSCSRRRPTRSDTRPRTARAWVGIPLGGDVCHRASACWSSDRVNGAIDRPSVEGRHGDPFAMLGPHQVDGARMCAPSCPAPARSR